MKISLRTRALLLIAAINVAMFGSGLYFLGRKLDQERQSFTSTYSDLLVATVQPTITPGGDISVAPILRWPNWKYFDDAIILRDSWDRGPHGEIQPRGAFLNPLGRGRRSATFDQQAVLHSIVDAIAARSTIASQGGIAIPILDRQGQVWGGSWFALANAVDARALVVRLLPWFLLSTALLTLGTFLMLRRFVLDPVRQLASGAARLRHGELSVRLAVPARTDELSELIRSFNAMAEQVQSYNERLAREVELATEQVRRAEAAAMTQRRLAATGELAAGIAHEINNPLGGLLNAAEVLAKDELPQHKRAQYHALLKGGLERIQATVGKLLRFTPRASEATPLALVDVVLDALALVQHRADQQGVAIVLTCEGAGAASAPRDALAQREAIIQRLRGLPLLLGKSNELAQAVLNLLVNALDALEEKPAGTGRITIDIGLRAGELRLCVVDNGPGVAPEHLPRLADLFFTTKQVGKGTGLGLALVHNLIAQHHGRVHLSSPPGSGLAVEIYLPVWSPPARDAARSS